MRLKNLDDIEKLGPHAQKQVKKALKQNAFFDEKKVEQQIARKNTSTNSQGVTKKKKLSRVMKTAEGLNYCPWPATDPFVWVHQALAERFGLFEQGGMLITEMIIAGGERAWRFDLCLIPTFHPMPGEDLFRAGPILLIESDGFGFHRSLDAFKNDRRKQSHALRQGCLVKRISTEDVHQRLDEVLLEIEDIMRHERIYPRRYRIVPKGHTQSVFSWQTD